MYVCKCDFNSVSASPTSKPYCALLNVLRHNQHLTNKMPYWYIYTYFGEHKLSTIVKYSCLTLWLLPLTTKCAVFCGLWRCKTSVVDKMGGVQKRKICWHHNQDLKSVPAVLGSGQAWTPRTPCDPAGRQPHLSGRAGVKPASALWDQTLAS